MNCTNHPDRNHVAFCQNCGKPLCQECTRTVGSAVYCEPCLAARLAAEQSPIGSSAQGQPSPAIATILGFIPGALMAKGIYVVTHNATLLPLEMTATRLWEVYALTLTMCVVSGTLAMLALRAADPAEIF